jgi:hypothetical protein
MSNLEFVPFIEKNTKENETFVFYLQWTGNEEQLTLLDEAIRKSCCHFMDGDYSLVTMDINVKIPESAVDIHTKLKHFNAFHNLFTKCTGTFSCPITREIIDSKDEYEIASYLDEIFYTCKIMKMFSN